MITTHLVVLSFLNGASTYVEPPQQSEGYNTLAGYHTVGPYALLDGFSPFGEEDDEAGGKLGGIRGKQSAGRVSDSEVSDVLRALQSQIAKENAEALATSRQALLQKTVADDVAAGIEAARIAAGAAERAEAERAARQDDELALMLIAGLI